MGSNTLKKLKIWNILNVFPWAAQNQELSLRPANWATIVSFTINTDQTQDTHKNFN